MSMDLGQGRCGRVGAAAVGLTSGCRYPRVGPRRKLTQPLRPPPAARDPPGGYRPPRVIGPYPDPGEPP